MTIAPEQPLHDPSAFDPAPLSVAPLTAADVDDLLDALELVHAELEAARAQHEQVPSATTAAELAQRMETLRLRTVEDADRLEAAGLLDSLAGALACCAGTTVDELHAWRSVERIPAV